MGHGYGVSGGFVSFREWSISGLCFVHLGLFHASTNYQFLSPSSWQANVLFFAHHRTKPFPVLFCVLVLHARGHHLSCVGQRLQSEYFFDRSDFFILNQRAPSYIVEYGHSFPPSAAGRSAFLTYPEHRLHAHVRKMSLSLRHTHHSHWRESFPQLRACMIA